VLLNNRVIWKDNATLRDLSISLSNPLSQTETMALVAAEDAIYLGSDLPFNHRWFEVSSANAVACDISIELWNGQSWKSAVDVIDQTKLAGATLAQSGFISWVPDRDHTWDMEQTTADMSDLSTLKIYDMFWVRLKFTADVTGTTALKYIGHKFSSDADLVAEYPSMASATLKGAYSTGKTTWTDQHFLAAEYIIQEMRAQRLVWSPNQILDWAQFKPASVHRTAAIIFTALGQDYVEELKSAMDQYKSALKIKAFNIDQNANARVDAKETKSRVEFLGR